MNKEFTESTLNTSGLTLEPELESASVLAVAEASPAQQPNTSSFILPGRPHSCKFLGDCSSIVHAFERFP